MTHLLSLWPRFVSFGKFSCRFSSFFARAVPGQGCRRIVPYKEGVKVFIKSTLLHVKWTAYKSAVVNKAVYIWTPFLFTQGIITLENNQHSLINMHFVQLFGISSAYTPVWLVAATGWYLALPSVQFDSLITTKARRHSTSMRVQNKI